MATVLDYDPNDLFTVRVYKYHELNPRKRWVNSYEVRSNSTGGGNELLDLLASIMDFEARLHHENVIINYGTISTWAPDSKPYNGDEFIRRSLGIHGYKSLQGTTEEALVHTLRVEYSPLGGFTGFRLYRGVLTRSDTTVYGGEILLTDSLLLQTQFNAALSTAGLNYMLENNTGDYAFVMVNANGTRPITVATVAGITTKGLDNRYFDRVDGPAQLQSNRRGRRRAR